MAAPNSAPALTSILKRPNPLAPASAPSPPQLRPQDDSLIFPQLTEGGSHVTEYQSRSLSGYLSRQECGLDPNHVRGEDVVQSGASSQTHVGMEAPSPSGAEKGQGSSGVQDDDKLVTWLEDDPANPRNFGHWKKWAATSIASALCFNAAFASAIVTGGIDFAQRDLGTSEEVINLTVALYVIGFGCGPLVLAPVSELIGRKKIYLLSMFGMTVFSIPCALAPNAATLIVFRLISGLAASAPPTNAAGTIADVWDANSRGMKMSVS